MKKHSFFKTILSIMLGMMLVVAQVVVPLQAEAGPLPNWNNPNQNGNNPYRIKITDALNPQLLTSVVGCTGIVNRMAALASSGLKAINKQVNKWLDDLKQKILDSVKEKAKDKIKEKASEAPIKAELTTLATETGVSGNLAAGSGGGPGFAGIITGAVQTQGLIKVQTLQTGDAAQLKKLQDDADAKIKADQEVAKAKDAETFREECLNGIAVQLAKNQLTSMTRDTMTWITKGFGGNPMYVRNADAFMDSITRTLLQKETDFFAKQDPRQFPYGKDYARSEINAYKASQNH